MQRKSGPLKCVHNLHVSSSLVAALAFAEMAVLALLVRAEMDSLALQNRSKRLIYSSKPIKTTDWDRGRERAPPNASPTVWSTSPRTRTSVHHQWISAAAGAWVDHGAASYHAGTKGNIGDVEGALGLA